MGQIKERGNTALADEAGRKSLTDMMYEINDLRYMQHRTFEANDGISYSVVNFAFDSEECLNVVFHDVRQPLVNYVMPVPDFKSLINQLNV